MMAEIFGLDTKRYNETGLFIAECIYEYLDRQPLKMATHRKLVNAVNRMMRGSGKQLSPPKFTIQYLVTLMNGGATGIGYYTLRRMGDGRWNRPPIFVVMLLGEGEAIRPAYMHTVLYKIGPR